MLISWHKTQLGQTVKCPASSTNRFSDVICLTGANRSQVVPSEPSHREPGSCHLGLDIISIVQSFSIWREQRVTEFQFEGSPAVVLFYLLLSDKDHGPCLSAKHFEILSVKHGPWPLSLRRSYESLYPSPLSKGRMVALFR
jgi:hypothetical protein